MSFSSLACSHTEDWMYPHGGPHGADSSTRASQSRRGGARAVPGEWAQRGACRESDADQTSAQLQSAVPERPRPHPDTQSLREQVSNETQNLPFLLNQARSAHLPVVCPEDHVGLQVKPGWGWQGRLCDDWFLPLRLQPSLCRKERDR